MRRVLLALPIALIMAWAVGCSSDDASSDTSGVGGSAGSAGSTTDGSAESAAPDAAGSDSETQEGAVDGPAPDAPADSGTDADEPGDASADAGDSSVEPSEASADAQPGEDASEDVTPLEGGPDGPHEAGQDAPQEAGQGDAPHDAPQEGSKDGGNKPNLQLRLDHDWIWTAVEDDAVTADCVLIDALGNELPDPADLAITAAAPAIPKGPGSYAWADAGVYPIQCESASLGLSTTRDVVVSFEGVDYRYVQVTREVSELDRPLARAIAANEAKDSAAYNAAVSELKALAARIPDVTSVGLLVDNPNGWPSDAQLTTAGFTPGAQDAAWLASLQALRQAVAAHRAVLTAMATPPSAADVGAVSASWSETRARLQDFQAITPSTFAAWKNAPALGLLIGEMGATSKVRANVLAAQLQASPPPPPPPPGELKPAFSLVGTLAAIAIDELLGSYTYESMLMDVGKVIVANAISIALKDLINKDLPLTANMPVIDSVHGSAAGFCGAGIPFQVVGSFNPIPTKNLIVFIPPQLSNDLSAIVDVVTGLDGITQEDNVLKLINQIRKLASTLKDLYKSAWGAGEQFIVLTPDGGDDMIVSYPALPGGLNCNQFKLPVAGTMIPIDEDWGRGAAINVNVLGESMSACQ